MKKVMVYAYTNFNLGDDLFLKILFERYPNTAFILIAPNKYKEIFNYKNVKIYSSDTLTFRGMNYVLMRLNKKLTFTKLISKKCDASVYIGGSIFQQGDNWKEQINRRRNLLNKNQPFYVLGSNFGPFDNEDFYSEYKKVIQEYVDICFRDTYSYNLFKDLSNVRIADDIVFSLDYKNQSTTEKNIVISVIKPSYRSYLSNYDEIYYNKIKEITEEFIEKGYKVTLMSFCKHEGDEEAIKEIIQKVQRKYTSSVYQYNYRGNIDESLDLLCSSSLVIGTRFHAMILGWVFKKPVVPIAYSEKMTNVMKDIGFNGLWADFNTLEKLEPVKVYDSLKANTTNINKQILNSEEQFNKLDKFLLD